MFLLHEVECAWLAELQLKHSQLDQSLLLNVGRLQDRKPSNVALVKTELHLFESSLELVLRLRLVIQASGIHPLHLFILLLFFTLVAATLDADCGTTWDLFKSWCIYIIGHQLRDWYKFLTWQHLVEQFELFFVVG